MDANELLHYLRGFFELVPDPTEHQIRAIRNEVLRAERVMNKLLPIEMHSDCNCKGKKGTLPAT